jgi:hypothetical protein
MNAQGPASSDPHPFYSLLPPITYGVLFPEATYAISNSLGCIEQKEVRSVTSRVRTKPERRSLFRSVS